MKSLKEMYYRFRINRMNKQYTQMGHHIDELDELKIYAQKERTHILLKRANLESKLRRIECNLC